MSAQGRWIEVSWKRITKRTCSAVSRATISGSGCCCVFDTRTSQYRSRLLGPEAQKPTFSHYVGFLVDEYLVNRGYLSGSHASREVNVISNTEHARLGNYRLNLESAVGYSPITEKSDDDTLHYGNWTQGLNFFPQHDLGVESDHYFYQLLLLLLPCPLRRPPMLIEYTPHFFKGWMSWSLLLITTIIIIIIKVFWTVHGSCATFITRDFLCFSPTLYFAKVLTLSELLFREEEGLSSFHLV